MAQASMDAGLPAESGSPGEPLRGLPLIDLPRAPDARTLWSRAVTVVSIVVVLFTLNRLTALLFDYWLLQSLGLESVFWTNFRMGALLYVVGLLVFGAAALAPAFLHDLRSLGRSWVVAPGVLVATLGAYFLAMRYLDFLFGAQTVGFGEPDPVFGNDLGFYVFDLPYLLVIRNFALVAALVMLVFSLVCAYAARGERKARSGENALAALVGDLATPCTRVAVGLIGAVLAFWLWLGRYDFLIRDNSDSSITAGAEYVDVTGLFSNLNYVMVTVLVVLGLTAVAWMALGRLHEASKGGGGGPPGSWRPLGIAAAALLAFDFAFEGLVELRDLIFVRPNEPVIQLPYIQRHVEATRAAYGFDRIETVDFAPKRPGDPLPSADAMLASPTLRNAPLWPGFASYLERLLDPQHAQRILQTSGDAMIYGPTLDLFQQQQKLRTYYRFLNVDSVRYRVNGEKRMLVSGVRELPLFEPVPWLAYWGQRYMLFTHGFGLVMAPAGAVDQGGGLDFVSENIPTQVAWPELAVENERVYYGEGSATMAFSNVDRMKELDYPTEQDRAEIFLPADVPSGVPLDSLLKRVVFGWRGGRFTELVFSDLITPGTRVHYYRLPIGRLERVAPFLYFDTNPYAVAADGRIVWLVNALTTSDRYPYSASQALGDKSDERSPFPRPNLDVNYVEDSVKATVDGFTGEVRFYQMSDDPIVATWAAIYPELFSEAPMPAAIERQITFPPQLFHILFDDLYIYYHMQDPMYFFNLEDMWDDADEVLGPILDQGKAITFSIEPYPLLLETGGVLPASKERTQYSLLMLFTPEKALNLRAVAIAYQDPPDYGRLTVLQIPKGQYVMGPEQADAVIDQDPEISQNFSWWNRRGMDVIRGHTTLMPIGDEILYVEPVFLRSKQNPVTQLKKVVVVFREQAVMADTLEDAVREAVSRQRRAQTVARSH